MEERNVEKQLQEYADNLKKKDFSERWEVIKDKIQPSEDGVRDEVLCEQKVVASTCGSRSESGRVKKKALFFSGLIVLLIAVCLAIVLPIMLRKPQERFLALADLNSKDVSQSQFEDELSRSGLKIIDLSSYESDMFYILVAEDNKVMGGGAEVFDFQTSSYTMLRFYSSKVKSEFEISDECKTCTINNVVIKYVTNPKNENFNTVAIADSGTVIYKLDCTTVDENVIPVFERLFGNA